MTTTLIERVAKRMLADELATAAKPRDLEETWAEESQIWLANSKAAITELFNWMAEPSEEAINAAYDAGCTGDGGGNERGSPCDEFLEILAQLKIEALGEDHECKTAATHGPLTLK